MSFQQNLQGNKKRIWHTIVLPSALLVLLSGLSFFAAHQVADQQRSDRLAQFNATSVQTTQLLQEKINRFPQLLKSTRGMVLNSDYRPGDEGWQNFFNSLNLDYRDQGIIGITFTEYVDQTTRDIFIDINRKLYGEQFDIFPQTDRDESFVVMQAVPASVADKIRGYDIASEIKRYEAAQYAKNSGQIAVTDPISLLPTAQHSLDYLMLAPVYANAEQPDSGLFLDSDIAFSGWITIGFSLNLLIDQTLEGLDMALRVQVKDPRSNTGTIDYDTAPGEVSRAQLSYQRVHTLEVSDEPLTVTVMPAKGSPQLSEIPSYDYEVLIVSLLTSLLAAISLRQLLNARQGALRLAARMIERSKETNIRYQALFEQSPEAVLIHINRGIVLCNRSALRLLGAEHHSELVGRDILDLVHPDSRALVKQRLSDLESQSELNVAEQRILRLDGSDFLAEVNSSQISYDGQPGIQVMFRDITAVKESRNQAKIAQRVLEHTSEAIMVTNVTGDIVMVNPAFTELTGYQREETQDHTPAMLASGHHDGGFYAHMWQTMVTTGNWLGEIVNRRKNGEIYIQKTNISAVYDKYGDISHFVCLMSDITEQKKALDSIRFQAMHDNLTRLPNRAHFEAKAENALRRAQQTNDLLAILFIDLDGFKPINDTYGHRVGDNLLIALADKLTDALRPTDMVSRIGGDEFLILTEELVDANTAQLVGQRVLDTVNAVIEVDGIELNVSASIGISIYPIHGATIPSLIDAADRAMYKAKRLGKGQIQLAKPETVSIPTSTHI